MAISHIAAEVNVPVGFTMQSIYESVAGSYPAGKAVTGISIPLLGITCKEFGVINPIQDIKEAVIRMYNYAMGSIIKPIFEALVKLVDILSAGILDFKLPFLDLTITDLFQSDTYDRVKAAVLKLYKESIEELKNLLKTLGIPWPFFENIGDPIMEVALIVKALMTSFWDAVIKQIWEMVKLILLALEIYDRINQSNWAFSWQQAIDAVLASIAEFFVIPPTIQDILDALKEFAKQLYGDVVMTYEMLIKAIEKFKLPVFGLPLDWNLPESLSALIPNVDFMRLLIDMKVWMTNFLMGIVNKFVDLISTILQFFGINLEKILSIKFPILLCVVEPPALPAPAG